MKHSDYEKQVKPCFYGFSQERAKGNPLSGPIVQGKALFFQNNLQEGDANFTASTGWFDP